MTTQQRPGWRWAMRVCALGVVSLACAPMLAETGAVSSAVGGLQAAAAPQDSCDIKAPGRVVAVGDVHGAYDRFVGILREAALVDTRQRWTGGNATLVQVGDLLDRGGDSRRVLDLLRRLEADAAAAGGHVRVILGNHEVMRMAGDWRYVSDGEYEAFRSADASNVRERRYQQVLQANQAAARAKGEPFDAKAFRTAFLEKTPLGAVEMRAAFSETGDYGRWLRQHDIMLRINGTIFVHAGPAPVFATGGCAGLNADARAAVKTLDLSDPDILKKLLWSPEGPLWYRGFVGVEPVASADEVTGVLAALGGTRMVVGHTVSPTAKIRTWYDGRVLQIDTGMTGAPYYPNGAPAALEIQGGTFTAIYEGKREVIIPARAADSGRR